MRSLLISSVDLEINGGISGRNCVKVCRELVVFWRPVVGVAVRTTEIAHETFRDNSHSEKLLFVIRFCICVLFSVLMIT